MAGASFGTPKETQMQNITQKQKENILKVSEFDTIFGDNFQEITLDKFLKTLDKNIESKAYNITYDKVKSRFNVDYEGKIYYLELDKEIMDNYNLGNYNYLTEKLKTLVDKEQHIIKTEEDYQKEQERKAEIIKNINSNGLIPNTEARDIYLEYLEDNNKKNKFNLFKNLGIVTSGFLVSLASLASIPTFLIASVVTGSGEFIAAAFMLGAPSFSIRLVSELNKSKYLSLRYRIRKIKEIIKDFSNYKINKLKIKKIKKINKNQGLKSTSIEQFDKTLSNPVKEDLYKFNDKIMQDISSLIDRLNYINPNDRNDLLNELKSILNEYAIKFNNIERTEETGLRLDNDSIVGLKLDMISKISIIEKKMLDARNKDMKINQVSYEKQLLEEKIDNSYIEIDEIEEEKKRRESGYVRIKKQDSNYKYNKGNYIG